MPSAYCIEHAGQFPCNVIPNYSPPQVQQTTGQIPVITATQGGITVATNKLDKVLASILSGLALIKGAQSVPTTISNTGYGSGYGTGGYTPEQLAYILQSQQQNNNQNPLGKIGSFFSTNPEATLIGAALVAAYLIKSPRR